MGSKEYTGETAEVFGERPAKVFIEQEDGPPKNWEWGEFRERLIDLCYGVVKEVANEVIDVTIDATIEFLRTRASSPEEAAKIAFDEVRRRRGGRLLRPENLTTWV
ncbi:unnamed protein product [marine sediment metagenome]|uniref:Uncharacterized protein n=1 Tax=marine sediment metagenome TaxID=412755 RepID=X1KM05_9ZZZZ